MKTKRGHKRVGYGRIVHRDVGIRGRRTREARMGERAEDREETVLEDMRGEVTGAENA